MLQPEILLAATVNGVMVGAIYALIAVGLTLIYGVLHIINFAHGALLTLALFAVYFANQFGFDPYVSAVPLAVLFFCVGYGLQRFLIMPASNGEDRNFLLVTLGISIIIQNVLLFLFRSDTRTVDIPYANEMVDLSIAFLSVSRVYGLVGAIVVSALLWLFLARTDTGKAIRAVSKERTGAALQGIEVDHVYAVTFGLGTACLAVAAALLLPNFYVNPGVGEAFVLIAFTIVVLGGMGSVTGALLGGLLIGIVESISGLFLGESLGQIGIFLIFILVLLVRPQGLFGAKS